MCTPNIVNKARSKVPIPRQAMTVPTRIGTPTQMMSRPPPHRDGGDQEGEVEDTQRQPCQQIESAGVGGFLPQRSEEAPHRPILPEPPPASAASGSASLARRCWAMRRRVPNRSMTSMVRAGIPVSSTTASPTKTAAPIRESSQKDVSCPWMMSMPPASPIEASSSSRTGGIVASPKRGIRAAV